MRQVLFKLHCPSPRQAVEQIRIHLARDDRFKRVADDVFLAVVEAIGNVVEHTAAQYTVSVTLNKKRITVDLIDYGKGFRLHGRTMPPLFAESGRGIPIMQSIMDSVEYKQGKHGNRLRLLKNLTPL